MLNLQASQWVNFKIICKGHFHNDFLVFYYGFTKSILHKSPINGEWALVWDMAWQSAFLL